MPFYVPAGPRAEALMRLDKEHAADFVAGLAGKVSVFRRPLGGMPYLTVAVPMDRRPSLTFDPSVSPFESYWRKEIFEALTIWGPKSDGTRDRFFAYCNEPKHLDEFLFLANGKWTAKVTGVSDLPTTALTRRQ